MNNFIPSEMSSLSGLLIAIVCLAAGIISGYLARQTIAKRNYRTIEAKIRKRIEKVEQEKEKIIGEAKQKASQVLEKAEREDKERRKEVLKSQELLLKREESVERRISDFEQKEKDFSQKVERLKNIKKSLEDLKAKALKNLEQIANLSQTQAKKELLEKIEEKYQAEILQKIRTLEKQGLEKYEKKAKEALAFAIQKCAISQAQEITTSTVALPNEEIKGRIIGKEGRNIRTLEQLTGTEILVDEAPEAVMISCFDPIRRQIAKRALEKLIEDGRIQPARIEEQVAKAREEMATEIKEAGETAVYEAGIVGLDPRLVQLLGRLKFRTSYGQNVLLHSMEVAYLAEALADELGADSKTAKKAGLLHDIGKTVDHQIQGSHVDIGIRILEKFNVEKEVIAAMKSHHEEYPYETLEAIIVQVADQISGARPGARKDTLEDYLKRLGDLENIALSFAGVKQAWALHAGREIRVFVKPGEVDDLKAHKLAREIANKIQEELRYPGEIKVNVIRETRVIEYAK